MPTRRSRVQRILNEIHQIVRNVGIILKTHKVWPAPLQRKSTHSYVRQCAADSTRRELFMTTSTPASKAFKQLFIRGWVDSTAKGRQPSQVTGVHRLEPFNGQASIMSAYAKLTQTLGALTEIDYECRKPTGGSDGHPGSSS